MTATIIDGKAVAAALRAVPRGAPALVVLLSARVDGTPALGAELLVVVGGGGDGAVRLELPDGMEEQLAAMA